MEEERRLDRSSWASGGRAMAGNRRAVIGGFAVLAIVLMGLACSSQDEPGAKAGAVKDAARPRPKPQVTAQAEAGAKEGTVKDATLPGPKPQVTVDLGGGVTMQLILIPPGTFDMGSDKGEGDEKPVHKVTLKKGFYIGTYEVTQEQWQAVMKPVDTVDWDECRDFAAKLSEKTGRKFALPSESEWEYACRAGRATEFCDGEGGLDEYAWYEGNSELMTHPVGHKKPNKFGLFDMHGNVDEWCQDVWHESYEGAPTDGSAWVEGGDQRLRVLRGGSWRDNPSLCRSASRRRITPSTLYYVVVHGCRVVLRDS
jgi:formylglycine-generating enzyme required for sulfatase activity